MAAALRLLCVLALTVSLAFGDLYLHNPRGSNNRLNERSANRNNANRLFDSQVSTSAKTCSLALVFNFGFCFCLMQETSMHACSEWLETGYVFVLQNNNRGGYNAGDVDDDAFSSEDEIYYMVRANHLSLH